ncbi:MAG: hypothetical protein WC881_03625, partial [Elusimicrobiota bacterium]
MFITVVGEDPKFCAQLEQLLLSQNHKVTSAPQLARVPGLLQAMPPHLLVVASDQNPGAVAALLKSIRDDAGLRRLPILCVNPRGGSSDGVAYLDAGADDFINRPFNPQIF